MLALQVGATILPSVMADLASRFEGGEKPRK